jgi:hypothetical protein
MMLRVCLCVCLCRPCRPFAFVPSLFFFWSVALIAVVLPPIPIQSSKVSACLCDHGRGTNARTKL